jgi:type IV secretion system protein VirB9
LTRVQVANRNAVSEPTPDNFLGAVQVYPWNDGALYRLYAAPRAVSDVALQPGETLVSVAAGDTVRWIIGDTSSGSGATRRTHILVKPTSAGLATNLVIATDRRVYHVEARSNVRTAMASISWSYPEDALVALRGAPAPASDPVAAGMSVDQLNFDYRIEGDNPPWRPIRAFDDGRQLFIEFAPSLAQGEAPPLFVTGDKGQAELVNYRIRGHYYVVDRLFAAAELRMGEKRQQVVRILRGADAYRGRRY